MPKVRVNNLDFFYELQGKGHPLVLIAGYSCDHRIWNSVREMLAEHFQLLLFDNRGVGQSDYPHTSYTIEQMASDTLGIIDHLELKEVHILGHSMGGAVAQVMARKYAAKIGRVILANSFTRNNAVSKAFLNFFFHLRMDGVHPARIAEGILPLTASSDFMEDAKKVALATDRFLNDPYPQSEIGQKYQLEALADFDSRSWIEEITSEMLIIGGEEDALFLPRELHLAVQKMSNARFVTIPKMGHMFHLENPKEFTRLVLEFLK